ncbi:hypothetical protein CFP65_7651 [Kitasatospora sp. MMS16-BH015]|uniref:hypothetical protein n=1 Tax=Kitasatospora sp. MMS16-BH015 TaxID=2018025 RepID=UPI000CA2FCE4|nr:hypothetical protein [Kitasatospora sp. MMS16-BH015]AUG74995.1 hypothetical protein CFP65_0005 [Kitasatospora sp. MMS16-BH015]AUG82220.1 hypothetical protein CFP65_7651 [Kitasatospora sp. MMS16-BH015]
MAYEDGRPTVRGLVAGLQNVSGMALVVLVAASVGTALIAAQPVPLLALIVFSVLWAATLVAVAGALARWAGGRRRHGPLAR